MSKMRKDDFSDSEGESRNEGGLHETTLQVKMSHETKLQLRVQAAKRGLPMSEYVRSLVRENEGVEAPAPAHAA